MYSLHWLALPTTMSMESLFLFEETRTSFSFCSLWCMQFYLLYFFLNCACAIPVAITSCLLCTFVLCAMSSYAFYCQLLVEHIWLNIIFLCSNSLPI
jgi:hypothetical protein